MSETPESGRVIAYRMIGIRGSEAARQTAAAASTVYLRPTWHIVMLGRCG